MENILKRLGIEKINSGCNLNTQWQPMASDTKLLDSTNPATEVVIGSIQTCSRQHYETMLQAAQQTFLEWRNVPAPKRGEIIRQIGQRLREHKNDLGTLVSLEMGKSKQEGDGEVQEMIDMADFAVGQSRMLYGNTMHSERPHHRMYEQWHPLGIVGIITAFNFPVAVWAWNAFIAAIAGNTVIWKPSHKVPLCAIAVQNICNQVLQANGYAQHSLFSVFIPNDKKTVDQFVNDTRIPLISFTGSTAIGQHVSQQIAKRLGRCILELGGNNAIIVDETADLALALPAILFGAIGTTGQRCTTLRRLFIHHTCYETLVKRLIHAYRQIRIGNPLDANILMGPLVDQQAVDQFITAINEIKAENGEILFGGNVLPRPGFYVEPTLVQAKSHWPIAQRETFAPILYVMSYEDLPTVITEQNQVSQGLSSALFTTNLQNAELFLSVSGSDCGIANINIGTSGAEIGGAFGGEKATGGGREAGSDAWKAYMRRQTNTINWGSDLPLAQGIQFALDNR